VGTFVLINQVKCLVSGLVGGRVLMTEHGLAITSEASDLVDTRRISNSEVSTWLTCQQRYYYEFDLKLAPIHNTEALSRGILGHEVLAKYYIGP
jgi:hypothetical protein